MVFRDNYQNEIHTGLTNVCIRTCWLICLNIISAHFCWRNWQSGGIRCLLLNYCTFDTVKNSTNIENVQITVKLAVLSTANTTEKFWLILHIQFQRLFRRLIIFVSWYYLRSPNRITNLKCITVLIISLWVYTVVTCFFLSRHCDIS